jgi:hypothetical protein
MSSSGLGLMVVSQNTLVQESLSLLPSSTFLLLRLKLLVPNVYRAHGPIIVGHQQLLWLLFTQSSSQR